MMEKQNFFPDAVASQVIDESFSVLMEWLDAYPDRDVSEFVGWREVASSPNPLTVPSTDL